MTLDDLITPLTRAEIEAAIYAALEASGASTTSWKSGAVVRTLITGTAIVLAASSQLQAAIAKSGFLALATGDWLTLVAFYVYGVTRDIGSFASGYITLDNTGGGVYSGAIGDLVVTNTTTGKSYRNTAAFSIGSMETGVIVAVEALELGADSTAAPGDIDAFETVLLGVTVSNAAALVGTDEEDDATLRLRCLEKTGTLSPNGPRDAYAYVARSTLDSTGAAIGVTRVRTIADGVGGVDVYLATGSGGVTGTVGDETTDLGAIDAAIQEMAAPLAITATVQTATALAVAVTYELWLLDTITLTESEIDDAIALALTTYLSAVPIGGYIISPASGRIYVSALESVIGSAVEGVIEVVVTAPAADIAVDVDEATVAGTITATATHLVAGPVI